jgi:hypothetical protein
VTIAAARSRSCGVTKIRAMWLSTVGSEMHVFS